MTSIRRKKQEPPRPWGFSDLMVTAAFRYCLGRQTYIVGCCADWIIEQWPNFADNVKILIKRELEKAFQEDDKARATGELYKPLGHNCDRQSWERVRDLWADEQPGA